MRLCLGWGILTLFATAACLSMRVVLLMTRGIRWQITGWIPAYGCAHFRGVGNIRFNGRACFFLRHNRLLTSQLNNNAASLLWIKTNYRETPRKVPCGVPLKGDSMPIRDILPGLSPLREMHLSNVAELNILKSILVFYKGLCKTIAVLRLLGPTLILCHNHSYADSCQRREGN